MLLFEPMSTLGLIPVSQTLSNTLDEIFGDFCSLIYS